MNACECVRMHANVCECMRTDANGRERVRMATGATVDRMGVYSADDASRTAVCRDRPGALACEGPFVDEPPASRAFRSLGVTDQESDDR